MQLSDACANTMTTNSTKEQAWPMVMSKELMRRRVGICEATTKISSPESDHHTADDILIPETLLETQYLHAGYIS